MSERQSGLVSYEVQKTEYSEQQNVKTNQQAIQFQQKQPHTIQSEQQQTITANNVDTIAQNSYISKGASMMSQGVYQQVIPLSHQRREKSLSPIKRQNSINLNENPSVTFNRRNTHTNLQINPISQQIPQSHSQTIHNQSLNHPSPSPFSPKQSQSSQQSIIHTSFKQQPPVSNIVSSRKFSNRRTQIFSSDRKQVQTSNLKLNRNTVAQQIFNLNKQQRTINRHQLYEQIERQSVAHHNLTPSITNSKRKSRREQSLSLSRSKKNEMRKLQVISASPLKATEQYWQGVYPQSKKYINSLKDTLIQQKDILKKWQCQLQTSLRQNLYQVEQILLQKLYQISRECVKTWIQQQLQTLQALFSTQFSFVNLTQLQIENNQTKLQQYDRLLQQLNKSFNQSHQATKALALFQKGIYSAEINQSIAQTSQKVKQVVSMSEQLVTKICQSKLAKAKKIHCYYVEGDQHCNRIDKFILNLLTNIFQHDDQPQQHHGLIITPSQKHSTLRTPSKPNFDIGQKIKMILNNKSDLQQPYQTTRQQIVKQFEYSDKFIPYSQRKYHQTPIIKNNQKEFQEFKYEFQKRKKNFITDHNKKINNSIQTDRKKRPFIVDYHSSSVIGSNTERNSQQTPISQRSSNNKPTTTFDQKLTNLFKKITQQKQDQQPQNTNRSSIQTNYFNDYNDLIRKKKKQNRENFFRYSQQ